MILALMALKGEIEGVGVDKDTLPIELDKAKLMSVKNNESGLIFKNHIHNFESGLVLYIIYKDLLGCLLILIVQTFIF